MAVLSNIDIEKELVNGNISIFPFSTNNLKAASYNLTASHLAWKIPEQDGDTFATIYDGCDKLIIPGKSTVLIVTNETIWISERIAGTYHSKVRLVSEGTGHIGTTLDPGYLGVSVITIHNHTKKNIELETGKTTFASLMFQFVRTKSEPEEHDNNPGRPDILNRVGLTNKEEEWLYEQFRNSKVHLRKKLESSQEFQDLVDKSKKNKIDFSVLFPYIAYAIFIIAGSYLGGFLLNNSTEFSNKSWYSTANFLADKGTNGITGALILQLIKDIQKITKQS
ncbi:deoxycytidine triphosphate deaminase [Dolichospermum sp. UHCC 0259]|uniref:dCTP deaminase domain-containing protein n=1 Tax=Dolichospermum sp. UHCC 0259 TaxID=2590010 RepID=UPI0014474FC3|nr:deoxycytidine triphosphate deaminase [Dolichospermum sp. UHCC 0259]MTJ48774.1 deoxycytidine triphosphate deaminase [Dolichospermum sp. UHCC 0259]